MGNFIPKGAIPVEDIELLNDVSKIYELNIVRKILPSRDIGVSRDIDFDGKHQMFMVAEGFTTNEVSGKDIGYVRFKEMVASGSIHKTEDYVFIHGEKVFGLVGIDSTKTIRDNLLSALMEFDIEYIISSHELPAFRDIKTFVVDHIPKNVYYLVPRGIKNSDAEFVISQDITNDVIMRIGDMVPRIGMRREICKENWHETKEWVTIEVHNPDKFIKVCEPECFRKS
jgi:hypothetical protein